MNARNIVAESAKVVNEITPSVISLAVAAGVTPKKFADAMGDEEARTNFLVALQQEVAKNLTKKAKEEDAR